MCTTTNNVSMVAVQDLNVTVDVMPTTHEGHVTCSHFISHVTGGTIHTIASADPGHHYSKYKHLQLKRDSSSPAETTYSHVISTSN